MINPADNEQLTPIVSRFLNIEDVTTGDSKQTYIARFRGRLRIDSQTAYDQIAALLRPLEITPLFRNENDQHVIYLVQGVVRPKPSKTWVNAALMVFTILSVVWTGLWYTLGNNNPEALPSDFASLLPIILKSLGGGVAFAASLLGILLAHEFGHYLVGRFHKTNVTLPYFLPLPFPLSLLGTLGAFIQMKEVPKNRRILLDIGIAGPLAGLVVTVPVLILGLSLSSLSSLPASLSEVQGLQLEGNSILYLGLKYLVFGKWLPQPENYAGISPLLYWLRYFFTGRPFPVGGQDVLLHPVAWAGWAGLLVTALNLIPAGQLDGGHLMYVLLGKRAPMILPFILTSLAVLGIFWPGWWLWALLIFFLGRTHAEPLDQITPLNPPRIALAVLGFVVFILVFSPVPLLTFGF